MLQKVKPEIIEIRPSQIDWVDNYLAPTYASLQRDCNSQITTAISYCNIKQKVNESLVYDPVSYFMAGCRQTVGQVYGT